jgi:CelD/BcsL family acetyltransferase involved in cellulose biosynthesis
VHKSESELADVLERPMERTTPSTRHLRELQAVTVFDFEGLSLHFDAWDRLASSMPQPAATALPAWVNAFLRHRLKQEQCWLCSFVYDGDQLVGALPLIWRQLPIPAMGRPILQTPSDQHTPSGDILLHPDYAGTALTVLIAEVTRQVPNHLGLSFKAVRRNSPLWSAVLNGKHGHLARVGLRVMYSFLDAQGSFDGYMAGLGSIRKNVRRYRKKLERRGGVSVEVTRGTSADEALLREYLALEAAGWKGRNGSAMADDPNTVAFYETLIDGLSRRSRWEWHTIRVDGRLVAAQMGVVCGRSLMLPKYTFDENLAECRLGSLVTEDVYSDAFSRPEIDRIEHMSLSGPDHHWRMSQEEHGDLHLIRREPVPILLQLPQIAARTLYQDLIRPRIPSVLKAIHRNFRRRGDRKPRRASANVQNEP